MAQFARIESDKPEATMSLEALVEAATPAAKNELFRRANNKLAKKSSK